MTVTVAQLIAAGLAPTQAKLFADPFSVACERFEINTRPRLAAFFAQCAHESARFTKLEEGLYYRDPVRIAEIFRSSVISPAAAAELARNPEKLANHVYAFKNGNGGKETGDGWRFRGRGLIQVTGRANYRRAAEITGMPYVESPELLAEPPDACLASAAWWHDNRCNVLADASLIDEITYKVNIRGLGKAERREHFREALEAFKT